MHPTQEEIVNTAAQGQDIVIPKTEEEVIDIHHDTSSEVLNPIVQQLTHDLETSTVAATHL